MKFLGFVFLISITLASTQGLHGNSKLFQAPQGNPKPDCPEIRTLALSKCGNIANSTCFQCIFKGCEPRKKELNPCAETAQCVKANISKC